jgi:hypothetical protein
MLRKFKVKKLCRVCTYPIVFVDDAWFFDNKYLLNIHNGACRVSVEMSGQNPYSVHHRELTNINA